MSSLESRLDSYGRLWVGSRDDNPVVTRYRDCLSSQRLELTICPTEACNFRCVYCYEHFKLAKMKPETVVAIKSLLAKRIPRLKVLVLGWFGGEPLLAYDIILDILKFVDGGLRGSEGTQFVSHMSTNGYLLSRNRLKELVGLGITSYQITFDGYRDEHDRLRVLSGGGGSFDAIMRNILDARDTELDFEMIIRLHVNRLNLSSMKQMIGFLKDEIVGDNRFTLFIRNLSQLGGPNDLSLPTLEDGGRAASELSDFATSVGLKVSMVKPDNCSYICYAAKPNSFVIRADASVSKCTVALYDPRNIIGQLNADGTLTIDKEKLWWWGRGLFSNEPRELSCPAMLDGV